MPSLRWSRGRRDAVVAVGLALCIAFGWANAYRLFEDQLLDQPLSYFSDAHQILATVAAARRGDFVPFASKKLPSLGAPFVADWNDFPLTEDWIYYSTGVLARAVGVVAAINLGFLTACLLAGLAMFWVARRLGARRETAFMAGLLYGLAEFLFYRQVHHYPLLFCWVAPCQLLVTSWLASRRGVPLKSKRFLLAVVIVIASAWSFTYYAIFAGELFVLGAIAGLAHKRTLKRLAPIAALGVLFLTALVSVNLDSIIARRQNGPNAAAIHRTPSDSELYSLEPLHFLVPSEKHRWAPMRELQNKARAISWISGEIPGPYLGVVSCLFLAVLLFCALRSVGQRRVDRALGLGLTALFVTLAHAVGGFSSFLGLSGGYFLRSTNRASVIVHAAVLLFAAWWLSQRLRGRPAWLRWGVCALIGVAGAYEQVPIPSTAQTVAEDRRRAESDKKLMAAAEAALPEGAMVFQLPPMLFPEAPPVFQVGGYDMFRPTYYSTRLRFSHGDMKGRPNGEWKFRVASLPINEMLAQLKEKGFAAIYINRAGYPDGGQQAVAALVASGCTVLAEAEAMDSIVLRL